MNWSSKTVLITGGSGSFGTRCVEFLLSEIHPRRIRVFSNDAEQLNGFRLSVGSTHVDYILGDIRNPHEIEPAVEGANLVIHAAALKDVGHCEAHPEEAAEVNIAGSRQVASACEKAGIEKAILISTDKAVNPTSVYGATKMCAERIFAIGDPPSSHSPAAPRRPAGNGGKELQEVPSPLMGEGVGGGDPTRPAIRFATVRFGNMIGTAGSALPKLLAQRKNGTVQMTDPRMTRFWITVDAAVRFVIETMERMEGGEIFVPKLRSVRLRDLAEAIAPDGNVAWSGARPGEKIHETLLTALEAERAYDMGSYFVVHARKAAGIGDAVEQGRRLPTGYRFGSETNDRWFGTEELRGLISACVPAAA